MFVPCFSLFSVLEMRRRPDVYGRFKELFRVWPCMLVKSHEQLLEDEVRCYPDPSGIDPTLLGFSMLGGDGMDLARVLDTASEDEFFRGREKYWNDAAEDIVEGIASLVANFPPDGDKYSRDEVRHFVEMAGFSQVAMRQLGFARQMVEIGNQAVSIGAREPGRPDRGAGIANHVDALADLERVGADEQLVCAPRSSAHLESAES